MKVDAHHHLWRLGRGDYRWLTPDLAPLYRDFMPVDLSPELAASDVVATVLVQAAPTVAETLFLLGVAAQWPVCRGVVGWCDLAATDAPSRLAALAADPRLKGVRPMVQDEPDSAWLLQEPVQAAAAALARLGLAFDALVRADQIASVAAFADRTPGLQVVLDHAGKPDIAGGAWEPWAADIAALARRPNVACKLSGLLTEAGARAGDADLAPYVDHLLATFGPSRLMWGSDWPVLTLAAGYSDLHSQSQRLLRALSTDERDAIFGGTAQAISDL